MLFDLHFRQAAAGAAAQLCVLVLKSGDLVAITSGAAALARFVLSVRVVPFSVLASVAIIGGCGSSHGVGLVLIGLVIVAFAFPAISSKILVLFRLTRFRVEFSLKV